MHWVSVLARRVRTPFRDFLSSSLKIMVCRMKALLFTLVRAFEFELAVPANDITKKSFIVQRPLLKSNTKAGNQMPLILKPVNRV
jgi:hypothetical protein